MPLAEPAGLRGPEKRAKDDRADGRHRRELVMIGRLPQSWTPPDHLLDLRARVKLRHTLSEQRSEWQQRIQAVLCHHGCPQRRSLLTGDGREWLAAQPLPGAAREQVTVALAMIDGIEAQIGPLDKDARAYAARQVGCKALQAHYGIGPAVMILAELGDCTRFSSSRLVVRYAGTDITMRRSDQRRAPGHLSRPGPPALRWALFEAAQPACRKTSQDRRYYAPAAQRLGHDRACLSVARKLLKRSYHTCASSARRHCSPHERPGARQAPRHTDRRGRLPACPCPPPPGGRP